MTVVLSALAFIILLTVLILIHELGHYCLARYFGVTVEEFGFGLPPKLKTLFRYKGTAFTLNWIPFGGFVRLKGENALGGLERYEKGSFARASSWARFSILSGGVLMNFVLAIVLLTVGFSVGRWVPSWYTSVEALKQASERGEIEATLNVLIGDVVPGGAAEKAGIASQELLLAVDGTPVVTPDDVLALQAGKSSITYTVAPQEGGEPRDVTMPLTDGKAGVSIQAIARDLSAPVRPVHVAFGYALKESWFMTKQTVLGIGELFTSLFARGSVPEGVSGIVGIAVLTHGSVQEGFMTYLRLVALLSLSLAVLNVLPLPALDGGRILFVLVEAVIRRPINRKFELTTNAVGFFFILALIVIITFNDLIHLL